MVVAAAAVVVAAVAACLGSSDMPRGYSNTGSLDMSGLAGLGEFGQRAFDTVLNQIQNDRSNSLQQQALAIQRAKVLQDAELAQQEQRERMEEEDRKYNERRTEKQQADEKQFIDFMLADVDIDAADSLTPDKRPELYEVGKALQKQVREKAKEAKLEKEQRRNAQFLNQGGLGALGALPEDRAGAVLPGIASGAGVDPNFLGSLVEGLRARTAQERADRAANRSSPSDPYTATMERMRAKQDLANSELSDNPEAQHYLDAGNPRSSVMGFMSNKPGFYADPLLTNKIRRAPAVQNTADRARASLLSTIGELEAIAEVAAEAGAGGPAKEELSNIGRRIGAGSELVSAYQSRQSQILTLFANSRGGRQLTDFELRMARESFPEVSELVIDKRRKGLAGAAAARSREFRRQLITEHRTGLPGDEVENGKAIDEKIEQAKRIYRVQIRQDVGISDAPGSSPLDEKLFR